MADSVQNQTAIKALGNLSRYIELPKAGDAVLDLSGSDCDLSHFFNGKGAETARLVAAGAAHEGTQVIEGTPSATGLPQSSVDLVIVGGAQASAMDRDTLFEVARILKPEAPIAVISAASVSLPGTVAFLTQNLALQFNPFWRSADGPSVAQTLAFMAMSGFVGAESHSHDGAISFSRAAWVGRALETPIIAQAGMSPAELQDFKVVLDDYIRRDFGSAEFLVPYRTFTFIGFKGR